MTPRLALVGCGKMGEALLAGWLAADMTADDIVVVEPDLTTAAALHERYGVAVVAGADSLAAEDPPRGAIVFAVKPQALAAVADAYACYAASDCVFLSIAAGRTIASLQPRLGAAAAVVRAMPNTPAAVGRGASVACANARTSAEQRALCQRLLGAVGTVAWVDDEALLDAVTALSGSGPAYVFYLVECLAEAGAAAGLPRDLAESLARETVTGAGELLHRSPESAAILRRNVTSPGGTTAAALAVLMGEGDDKVGAGGLAALLAAAVEAATRRARALSQ